MNQSAKKKLIVIAGPTAVGKTAVAIQVADHFNTEIISADSRQCFRELNIGVARPSDEELENMKHHFIASHSITEEISAAFFEKYAMQVVNELFLTRDVVVMAGGTGLYIKAFCEGLDDIPGTDPAIRNKIIQHYNKEGLSWLQQQLQQKDPDFYEKGEIKNPQRSMRALEVMETTGRSIMSFKTKSRIKRDFTIIKIGLKLSREELQRNIDVRTDQMVNEGLVDEVKGLESYRDLNSLNTVGYKEIFQFLDGDCSLEAAVNDIKTHTRQYAKRQMTWFKKDNGFTWYRPDQVDLILADIKK